MKKKIAKLGIIAVLTFALILSSFGALPFGDTFAKEFDIGAKNQTTAQAAGAWDGKTATYEWYTKQPTAKTFYIATASDLKGFSNLVNGTYTGVNGKDKVAIPFKDKRIVLTADIVLNETIGESPNVWVPIGYAPVGHEFLGEFDGQGHTVSGVYITSGNYLGLFGVVGNDKVYNPIVTNVGVINSSINGGGYVGGVVGFNYGKITNCYNDGAVTGTENVGGVIGLNPKGIVTNCYNLGNVNGTKNVGGVVGQNEALSSVVNCYNHGDVTGTTSDVGGVIGKNASKNKVTNCYNKGAVSGTSTNIGGVVGQNFNGATTTNSYFLKDGSINNILNAAGTAADTKTATCGTFGVNGVSLTAETGAIIGSKDNLFDALNAGATAYNATDPGKTIQASEWVEVTNSYPKHKPIEIIPDPTPDPKPAWTYPTSSTISTKPFAVGEGSVGSPFEISTAQELANMSYLINTANTTYSVAGVHYKLTANIELNDTTDWEKWGTTATGVKAWTPIGNPTNQFKGAFDGNGKTVSGIYISGSVDNRGLFGAIASTATVQNVGVIKSYIKGRNSVGGVVGYNFGAITNCYNLGSVNGTGDNTGGVVGQNNGGEITNCYNTGDVTGTKYIGGVVGQNDSGSLNNCYNDGVVSGGDSVGGVVGTGNGTISNCYNRGVVTGNESVGGIIGFTALSTIINCYNTGNVTGTNKSGGVVGCNFGSTVANCYNRGEVKGTTSDVGGVAGENTNDGAVINCYNVGAVSGTTTNDGGVVGLQSGNNSATVNCYFLKITSINETLNAVGTDMVANKVINCSPFGADKKLTTPGSAEQAMVKFDANADLLATLNKAVTAYNTAHEAPATQAMAWADGTDGYPNHTTGSVTPPDPDPEPTKPFAKGEGTATAPYEISTAQELTKLSELINAADATYSVEGVHYKLTADIKLNGDKTITSTSTDATPWTPIGTDANRFKGVFDGDSHAVSGIYINGSAGNQGLFGKTSPTATVKNVGVINSYIKGGDNVGGVVGYNYGGVVINCYNRGDVNGSGNVGGVVGCNLGTADNCYNTGAVTGTTENVGGVAGTSNDVVINSYNTGKVKGSSEVGGVVGSNPSDGVVINCYNRGDVNGTTSNVGGVVGGNNGTVDNCYNRGAVSGTTTNIGGVVGFNQHAVVTNSYFLKIAGGTNKDLNAVGKASDTTAETKTATCGTFVDNVGTLEPEDGTIIDSKNNLLDALNAGATAYNGTEPAPETQAMAWVKVADDYPTLKAGGVTPPTPPAGGGDSDSEPSISPEDIFWTRVITDLKLKDEPVVEFNCKYPRMSRRVLLALQEVDKTLNINLNGEKISLTSKQAKSLTFDKASYSVAELKALLEVKPEVTPTPTPTPTEKPTEPVVPEKPAANLTWLWILLAVIVVAGAVVAFVVIKRKKK